MKVLENLENYDIPQPFRLTADEEVEFAKDLAEIVNALIPIRTSKLKTRQYFNQHLRLSSNELDHQREHNGDNDPLSLESTYFSKEGEYTWNSDLLQPVLMDILRPCEYQFGYVFNLINEDTAYRKGQRIMKGSKISDGLVQFANQFDIEEIRKKAKEIPDITARILYLDKVYTDYRIFDGLSQDEEAWVGSEIGHSLTALKEEAENELRLLKDSLDLAKSKKKSEKKSSDAESQRNAALAVRRGLLYDMSVLKTDEFVSLAIPVPEDWDMYSRKNKDAFSKVLDFLFEHSYDVENGFEKNKELFKKAPRLLYKMMDSFEESIKALPKSDAREVMKRFTSWMLETHKRIDKAYNKNARLYADFEPYMNDDEYIDNSQDTIEFKNLLITSIYGYRQFDLNENAPDFPESAYKVVLYNMWGDKFGSLHNEYSNKFGLEFKKRAVVNYDDNKKFFGTFLDASCLSLFQKLGVDTPFDTQEKAIREMETMITEKFYSMFRDYISRVRPLVTEKSGLDSTLLNWIIDLSGDIESRYEEEHSDIEAKCAYPFRAPEWCVLFFFGICSRIAYELALGYFKDFDSLDLMQGPLRLVPPPEPEEEPEEDPEVTEPLPPPPTDKLHSRTIDYEKLYNELNKEAFINTSLEEFTAAIDIADFSGMLAKAKDAGTRSGYIGGVKYIIKKLRIPLGSNWFNIACDNIGETYESLNKLNDTTRKIKNIDTSIFDDYIK